MHKAQYLGLLLLFTSVSQTQAEPFEGTIVGNFFPGDAVQFPNRVEFRFGEPDPNVLTFFQTPSFETAPNQPFLLGQFTFDHHANTGTSLNATFQTTLRFNNLEGVASASFDFDLSIRPGMCNTVSICLDPLSNTSFLAPDGTEYSLLLSGFVDSPNSTNHSGSNYLTAWKGGQAEGYVFASLIDSTFGCDPDPCDCNPPTQPHVPEPSAIALVGIGIGMIRFRRWVRR